MEEFEEKYFLEFGRSQSKRTRQKLIEIWNNFIYDTEDNSVYIENNQDQILQKTIRSTLNSKIKGFLENNPMLSNSIKKEIFEGMEKFHKNIENHPFIDESLLFDNIKEKTYDEFNFTKNEYFEFLEREYQEDINIDFFKGKMNSYSEKIKVEIKDSLKEELEDRWEALLQRKIDSWYMQKLEEWRNKLIKKLYEKMDQFNRVKYILSPFTDELGRLWDLSDGLWKLNGFDVLKHYADLIEQEPEIQKLAEMLGKMQEDKNKLVEELIDTTEYVPVMKVEKAGKEEFVGIHESADINNLLTSELALLGDKTTEMLFYLKLSERKLLTYDMVGFNYGLDKEEKAEIQMVSIGESKGPIIICVDTSGSMQGVPERVAKTLCFAILRIALLEKRKCYLISFSTGIQTIELTDFYKNLDQLVRFLGKSFNGGTDPTPALNEAIRMIKTNDYSKADILMISDFIMGSLPNKIIEDINQIKERDIKIHSLVISSSSNSKVLDYFTNNWYYQIGAKNPFKNILHDLNDL